MKVEMVWTIDNHDHSPDADDGRAADQYTMMMMGMMVWRIENRINDGDVDDDDDDEVDDGGIDVDNKNDDNDEVDDGDVDVDDKNDDSDWSLCRLRHVPSLLKSQWWSFNMR